MNFSFAKNNTTTLSLVDNVSSMFQTNIIGCPIIHFDIYKKSNAGVFSKFVSVEMLIANNKLQTTPFSNIHGSFMLRATSLGNHTSDVSIKLDYCGFETIGLDSPFERVFFDLLNNTLSKLNSTNVSKFFSLSDKLCNITKYELIEQDNITGLIGLHNGDIGSITGSTIKWLPGLSNLANFRKTLYIKATSKGSVMASKPIYILKCGAEQPIPVEAEPLTFTFLIGSGNNM